MRHIALITLHTPTATNCRGASALPFHLLAFRPKDVAVEVWSFNLNGCTAMQIEAAASGLGVKIHLVKQPEWFRLLRPAAVRLLLPKPKLGYLPLPEDALKAIHGFLKGAQAALWIYGEDIAHIASRFGGVSTVITTPDCEAMYYHRTLAMKEVPSSRRSMFRYTLMYHRYARMAAHYPAGSKIKYHLVGKEDALFLKRLNPRANVVFIRHPHYDLSTTAHNKATPTERVKILIAGRYDFTMAQAADEAFEAMKTLPKEIKDRYFVTFLGKGWEASSTTLRKAGFDVELKGFVEDYASEVSSHHIQLTPVSVGTGTKGKVLDAFANGLMVIGTPLALENIAVESGKECVEYRMGEELVRWLVRLAKNPAIIHDIAKAGKESVLREHGREKVAREFFDLFE